ncbi:histidine phosphatase superfamily (branch 1) domain-containing protein [Sarocladium implicatum]|nr:histidine phosphatase superfamily (branch 1) domain-containing protein [Sarocladium implicatum]
MAPTIHFVRHAQGYHNLSVENEQLPDPDLTPLGLEQCAKLRAAFPSHSLVKTLIASPIRRTLYTALNAFYPLPSSPTDPIIALDLIQEVSDSPCDTGSEIEKLREEFGEKVDLARVREGWNDKKNTQSWAEPTVVKLTARAKEARKVIRELAGEGDHHVVVVTHGAIVHYITDEWADIPAERATSWQNCELRSYQFADPTGQDEDAALTELPESYHNRTGGETPPNKAEQRAMRDTLQDRVAPTLKAQA